MENVKSHEIIILKLGALLLTKKTLNILEIGSLLQQTDADSMVNGGFWLYGYDDNDVYLSDRFIDSLLYKRDEIIHNVNFFYIVGNKEHLYRGFKMIDDLIKNKSETCFSHNVDYQKKNGDNVTVTCRGSVIYILDKPFCVIGTHNY